MAYVPQFIQTDTSVLQGTLNQYQQAYDTETNRQNQVNDTYSAIPTSQIDTADKNQVMGQFSKVREELDKKYNYDRSNTQYAKELASRITDLRANPLWGHLQQKEELSKIRTQLIAQKGADYHENFNPDAITLKDASKLQDWKPVDLKDVRESSGLWAQEEATNVGRSDPPTYPIKGMVEFRDYTGYENTTKSAEFLNGKEGHDKLVQSIIARGFDPNDPRVFQEAYTSALSHLVGKVNIVRRDDTNENILTRMNNKKANGTPSTSSLLNIVSTTPIIDPYAVKSVKEINKATEAIPQIDASIAKVDEGLKTAKTKDEIDNLNLQKQTLEAQKDQASIDLDMANGVKSRIMEQQPAKESIAAGKDLLKRYFPKLNDAQLNTEFDKMFTDLSNKVLTEGIVTGQETEDTQLSWGERLDPQSGEMEIGRMRIPKKGMETYIDKKVKEIYETGKGWGSDEDAKKHAEEFKQEAFRYLGGTGNYQGTGLRNNIINPINDQLKAGKNIVTQDYILPHDDPAKEKEIKNLVVEGLDVFSHIDTKKGKEKGLWSEDESNNLKDIFNDPGTTIRFKFDNASKVFMTLNNPAKKTTETLKIDPSINSYDVLDKLYEKTGEPRFLSQQFANVKFANKDYDLSDKTNYLTKQLGNVFRDPDGKSDLSTFAGFKISKTQDQSGHDQFTLYSSKDDKDGIKYTNQIDLLNDLAKYKTKEKEEISNATNGLSNINPLNKIDFSNIKGLNAYKNAIGYQENRGNYGGPPNETSGALGKYQFIPETLKRFGVDVSTPEKVQQFLNNPSLQEEVMNKFLLNNIDTIANFGYKIDVNNLKQEDLALLTVAHYGGPRAAKALLNGSPWLKEKQHGKKWNTTTGIEEDVVYPSVIDYLQQSMGIDSTKLKFGSFKK